MTSSQRQTYAREIVKVLEHRSPGYICTTADWDFLAKLMDREIPLAVVLYGIHDVKTPHNLLYCKQPIERHIEHWHKALA